MRDKLTLLVIPFLLILIGSIFGYTFLHWLLIIKLELISPKDFIIDFLVPIGITGFFAWITLRKRLKILKLNSKGRNLRDLYSCIAWIVLTIPLVISQKYLVTSTGKLTELNSINEINEVSPTKYYKLKKYHIDKNSIGIHTEFETTGRYNQSFNMYIYVAMAIIESHVDTLREEAPAWLGIKYYRSISNRLDSKKKEIEFQKFALDCEKDIKRKDFSHFIYLDRVRHSGQKEGFINAIRNNSKYLPNETIFLGVDEPFEAKNGNKLQWIIYTSLIALVIWLVMIIIPKIDSSELKRIKSGKPDKAAKRELRELLYVIKPREDYFITPILMYLNLGVFLIMVLSGLGFIKFKGRDLLLWGANYGPVTTDGEWWRLITSTFLHGGIFHLTANMTGLLFVGIFLEPSLGRVKYLGFYLLTGFFASIASIWWYDAAVSVGASGAIFGLYGIFLALLLTKVYPPHFGKFFLFSTLIFIAYNLIMGLTGGIDNAAHIGGLLSGFTIGLIIHPFIKPKV